MSQTENWSLEYVALKDHRYSWRNKGLHFRLLLQNLIGAIKRKPPQCSLVPNSIRMMQQIRRHLEEGVVSCSTGTGRTPLNSNNSFASFNSIFQISVIFKPVCTLFTTVTSRWSNPNLFKYYLLARFRFHTVRVEGSELLKVQKTCTRLSTKGKLGNNYSN